MKNVSIHGTISTKHSSLIIHFTLLLPFLFACWCLTYVSSNSQLKYLYSIFHCAFYGLGNIVLEIFAMFIGDDFLFFWKELVWEYRK